MNPDQLAPGERSASTSNRNFEGRQGKGGRTHLVSPLVAAATARARHAVQPGRPRAGATAEEEQLTWTQFTTHTGIGVPLRRSNVDTDQIIPAVYLKRVTRTGFEDGLFAAWRKDETFVLNNPLYAAGSVLVAGPDFGTGSSREHAVWALMNYGFRVVISLALRRHLPRQQRQAGPAHRARARRTTSSCSGSTSRTTRAPRSRSTWCRARSRPATSSRPFEVDDYTRWRLLEGLDDISLTLRHEQDVTDFESLGPPTSRPRPSPDWPGAPSRGVSAQIFSRRLSG